MLFFVLLPLPLLLLATSLATSRLPLRKAFLELTGRAVGVRLWGVQPPDTAGPYVLASVNVIGVGVHLFVAAPDGSTLHLKVAQARGVKLATGVIVDTRYLFSGIALGSRGGTDTSLWQ